MKTLKLSITGKNLKTVTSAIKKDLNPSLEEVSKTGKTFFYVFEKYSYLQNSDMSVVILMDFTADDSCDVTLVVAGGKTTLLQLDLFGREDSVLQDVKQRIGKICNDNNWQIA